MILHALKVVVLAGGGSPDLNYHSHLVHVESLVKLLDDRGVPRQDVAVFFADGSHPKADRVVVRGEPVPGEWVLEGTPLDAATRPLPDLVNTEVKGLDLRPATHAALVSHLSQLGKTMGAGDTLLIAVTDHGMADPEHERDTRILLWDSKAWSRTAFERDLAVLGPDVKLVMWMSQCFSGGFADVSVHRKNTCGAFSANDDSVAYGCFSELAVRPTLGHFMQVLDGLKATGSLRGASDWAVLTDDTPDVPHLTSDTYTSDALFDEAESRQRSVDALVDEGLLIAAADPSAEDTLSLRLAAKLITAYGLGPVTNQSELTALIGRISDLQHQAQTWNELWTPTLDTLREAVSRDVVLKIDERSGQAARATLRRGLIEQLAARTRELPGFESRIVNVYDHQRQSGKIADELEIKRAAASRVYDLFGRVAGPRVLPATTRQRLSELRACEATPLLPASTSPASPVVSPSRTVAELEVDVAGDRPGFYGVRYSDPPHPKRGQPALPQGPVTVNWIAPGGPAALSGLRLGDRVIAVDEIPLGRKGEFRESAFLSKGGQRRRLTVERDGAKLVLEIGVLPFPLSDRPPEPGERVPLLPLRALDGLLPGIGTGRRVVLVFWATWCGPCKRSLPLLKRFAEKNAMDVIAVTTEDEGTVRSFLKKFGPFPFPIALDEDGKTSKLFEVEGTPRFIHLDGEGFFVDSGSGFGGEIPLRDVSGVR